jgi:hypothetical protein
MLPLLVAACRDCPSFVLSLVLASIAVTVFDSGLSDVPRDLPQEAQLEDMG